MAVTFQRRPEKTEQGERSTPEPAGSLGTRLPTFTHSLSHSRMHARTHSAALCQEPFHGPCSRLREGPSRDEVSAILTSPSKGRLLLSGLTVKSGLWSVSDPPAKQPTPLITAGEPRAGLCPPDRDLVACGALPWQQLAWLLAPCRGCPSRLWPLEVFPV